MATIFPGRRNEAAQSHRSVEASTLDPMTMRCSERGIRSLPLVVSVPFAMISRWFAAIGSLLILAGASAKAQDTLSDSAWNADRARRAALRQNVFAKVDSAAKLVDTIVVRPAAINLRVGDSIPARLLYDRIVTIGLTARGDTVRTFAKTVSISRSAAIEMRDGVLYARAAGTAEVRVGTGRRFSIDDVTRPISRIPIIVQ
jgi:hypothetical protein